MATKAEELRQLNQDEIEEKVETFRKECFGLRLSAKTGKLEQTHKLGEIKRDIARLLTISREAAQSSDKTEEAPTQPKKAAKPIKAEEKEEEAPKKKAWFGKKKDK